MRVESRAKFLEVARSYMHTPFKHRGRSPRALDCAGLVVIALRDMGHTVHDLKTYGREPYRDGLRQCVQLNFGQPAEGIIPGDIALMKFDGDPHHIAIIGDSPFGYLTLLHAHGAVGKVVEHRLDDYWLSKIVEVYRLEEDE